jgi:Uri superfamily endonuclease
MAENTDNRALYRQGCKYVRYANGLPPKPDSVLVVARECGEGVKVVRAAYNFANHVDAVAAVVKDARTTILDGSNPHLTPKTIARLARRNEKRIQIAMALAARGLHPFGPVPPVGISERLIPWHFDLTRLHEASTLLQCIGPDLARPGTLTSRDYEDLNVHTTAIRLNVDALKHVLGRGKPDSQTYSESPKPIDEGHAVRLVKRARGLVEAVTGDMLRAAHSRPLKEVRNDLASVVSSIAQHAEQILAGLPSCVGSVSAPDVVDKPEGPDGRGGTYVVVLRAGEPAVVRLGALGTFRMPAGYWLYVGSAFGSGGVARRTNRHLGGTGHLLWNVDHLRGFANPTELWWTHHPIKVECRWAMALASRPECCVPAPRAGARDCKRCPAHLYRTENRPSAQTFAEQLGLAGWGGYTIHWKPYRKPSGRKTE